MRTVIQRVSEASVSIDESIVGEIDKGLLVLIGIEDDDSQEDIDYLVRKISKLRIFQDEDDKMNLSIQDVEGSILSISQFTLHANTKKGNRPSFIRAGKPDISQPMYEKFNQALGETGIPVETGEFGADMKVSLVNDGPVTIIIDSKDKEF